MKKIKILINSTEKRLSALKKLIEKESLTLVGAGNMLAIKHIKPEKGRYRYTQSLLENEKLTFRQKAGVFHNKKLIKYWMSVLLASEFQKERRAEFDIDVNRHIKHFDPTGKTLGCGCSFCGQIHRTAILKQRIKELGEFTEFIKWYVEKSYRGTNSRDDIKFELKKKFDKYTTTYAEKRLAEYIKMSLYRKDVHSLIELRFAIKGKIRKLKKQLSEEKKYLLKFSGQTGLPIGSRRSKLYVPHSGVEDALIELVI